MFVINDSTSPDLYMPAAGQGTGLNLSLRGADGYAGVAQPFPKELLVPKSDWQGMIQEQKDRKTKLKDLAKAYDLKCKDQARTNFCWINAPTYCVELTRLKQNQRKVVLSPASGGGPIKNFRNRGGWGKEALEWIADKGLVPADLWPANDIDDQYYTPENKQIALNYRADEWIELEPGNHEQLISCLLRGIPVAIGLAWWSHEVTAENALWVDGEAVPEFRNSWGMEWGEDGGYGVLQGRKMYADDAVACLSMLAAA